MNRLFRGYGFRNDNGGLEFVSEEYVKRRTSSSVASLVLFRKEHQSLEEEYRSLRSETTRGDERIAEWLTQYEKLARQLQDNADAMHRLILQCKTGHYADAEKMLLRQQLKSEKKIISKQMRTLKGEIDGYERNKKRFSMLECVLPELEEKIASKEKELSALRTFTVDQPGLLTFPWVKGAIANKVNLFADIFDYVAYLFLSNNDGADALPSMCDNIVLNDCRNFTTMLLNVVSYDRIFCYFPHTLLGDTLEKTIIHRLSSPRVVSMSGYYSAYTTIYDYAKTFDAFALIPCNPY